MFPKMRRLETGQKLGPRMAFWEGSTLLSPSGQGVPFHHCLNLTTCQLLVGLNQPGGTWIQNPDDQAYSHKNLVHLLRINHLNPLPDTRFRTDSVIAKGSAELESTSKQSWMTLSDRCQEYSLQQPSRNFLGPLNSGGTWSPETGLLDGYLQTQ